MTLQKLLWIFGLSVAVLLIGTVIYMNWRINKLTIQTQTQAVALMLTSDSVKQFKTKADENYGKFNAQFIQIGALQNVLAQMDFENGKLKRLGVQQDKVIEAMREELIMQGHDTIRLRDTIINIIGTTIANKLKLYNWNNGYLSLFGTVKDNDMAVNYAYKTGIFHLTDRVANKTIVTVYLSDPLAQISTGSKIIVENPRHWWDRWYFYATAGAIGGVLLAK